MKTEKLIESLCFYCQGDFSDRMVISFFVTHEDPSVRKMKQGTRDMFSDAAFDLHTRILFKNSIALNVPTNARRGTRVITIIGKGSLERVDLGGLRFDVKLDAIQLGVPLTFLKNEIKLLND